MKKLYNTVDKWTRIIISIAGLLIFSIMVVEGFDYSWGIVIIGAIGVLSFAKMLSNTLKSMVKETK